MVVPVVLFVDGVTNGLVQVPLCTILRYNVTCAYGCFILSFEYMYSELGQRNFATVTQSTLGMTLRFQYFQNRHPANMCYVRSIQLLGSTNSNCIPRGPGAVHPPGVVVSAAY